MPPAVVPDLNYWPSMFADAIIVAVISFSINISMAQLFARKHKYKVDSTQV